MSVYTYACFKRICVQVSESVCVRARFYEVVSIGLYV